MELEYWRPTVQGLLYDAKEAAEVLQDFLLQTSRAIRKKVGITPQTEDLLAVISSLITHLDIVIKYCEKIRSAIENEKWDEVIANFPTREWLGSLEDSFASLEYNSLFWEFAPAKESPKEFFAQTIFHGFAQVVDILEKVGIKGVRDRFLEHAPTEPMTERELEREYEARQPAQEVKGEWKDLERHFDALLDALREALADDPEAVKFIEGLKQDFETAKQKRKVDILRDIYRNLLNLQPHVPEDKMELYNETLNYFRLYALPLKKFLILGKILGSGR